MNKIISPIRDMLQQFGQQIAHHCQSVAGTRVDVMVLAWAGTNIDYSSSIEPARLITVLEGVVAELKKRQAAGAPAGSKLIIPGA